MMSSHVHPVNQHSKCATCGMRLKHILEVRDSYQHTPEAERYFAWQLQQDLRDEPSTTRDWEKAGRP